MLSPQQQNFLVRLFIFNLEKGMKTKQTKKIYKSTLSFYKSVKYLQQAGYIFKEREKDNTNTYFLTLKGEFLARCLCSLPDHPESWRSLGMKLNIPFTRKDKSGMDYKKLDKDMLNQKKEVLN